MDKSAERNLTALDNLKTVKSYALLLVQNIDDIILNGLSMDSMKLSLHYSDKIFVETLFAKLWILAHENGNGIKPSIKHRH